MSIEEKYAVSKRKKPVGTFTAKEIINLLQKRELSTIHKVKVDDNEVTVGEFTSAHDSGELPEQNIAEPTPEETTPKETKPKRAEKAAPKVSSSSAPPIRPKPNSSDPIPPAKPRKAPPPATTGNPSETPNKSADHKPVRSIKNKEDSGQTVTKPMGSANGGTKMDRSRSFPEQKSSKPSPKGSGTVVSFIRKTLLIGTFVIIAYVGASLLNHHKLKKELETFLQQAWQLDNLEVSGFTLDGYYLIDDPRKATIEVLRKGERSSYEFKVTGNGITSEVKLEME